MHYTQSKQFMQLFCCINSCYLVPKRVISNWNKGIPNNTMTSAQITNLVTGVKDLANRASDRSLRPGWSTNCIALTPWMVSGFRRVLSGRGRKHLSQWLWLQGVPQSGQSHGLSVWSSSPLLTKHPTIRWSSRLRTRCMPSASVR